MPSWVIVTYLDQTKNFLPVSLPTFAQTWAAIEEKGISSISFDPPTIGGASGSLPLVLQGADTYWVEFPGKNKLAVGYQRGNQREEYVWDGNMSLRTVITPASVPLSALKKVP